MPKLPSEEGNLSDIVDAQIKQQGTGCIAVKDGHVFTFTTHTLELLLEQSLKTPDRKVIVFVKTGVIS